MSTNTIQYEPEHLESIEKEYKEAENILTEVIGELKQAQYYLEEHYLGLANEINVEAIDRYIKHMEFLQLSCQATRAFVEYSKEDMIAADQLNAAAVSGVMAGFRAINSR